MKPLLATICIGSLALSMTAQGVDNTADQPTVKKGRKTQKVENATPSPTRQVKSQHRVSTTQANRRGDAVRERNFRNTTERNRNDVTVNRERNLRVNRERNINVNRERNVTVNRERNVTINRTRNVRIVNNWRGFSGRQYVAFRNYRRQWHDRGWWTSHYNRIVFAFGAPYYWNAGYWYPAWGYYPGYSYAYDGPIYGYNNLTPDRVVINVQSQLQRDGYYAGPIDGVLGPDTRQAIADFQADHGLAVTSAVDEPTLATLGLV